MQSGLIEPILGGAVGFALAQSANLVLWTYNWLMRPRLSIELVGKHSLLHSGEEQTEDHEFNLCEVYGFRVRNDGRSISHGVRFQLLRSQCRSHGLKGYGPISERTFPLAVYNQASSDRGPTEVTLVPGASVDVELARWTDDQYDVVVPSVRSLPEYFLEACSEIGDFKFSVVVFDDTARFSKREIVVQTAEVRRQIETGDWVKPKPSDAIDDVFGMPANVTTSA